MKAYIKLLFVLSLSGLAACSGKQEIDSEGQVYSSTEESTSLASDKKKEDTVVVSETARRRNLASNNSSNDISTNNNLRDNSMAQNSEEEDQAEIVENQRPTILLEEAITITEDPYKLGLNKTYKNFQELLDTFVAKDIYSCVRLFEGKSMSEIKNMSVEVRAKTSYFVLGFGPCIYLSFEQ